jgi:glycosyltransferase involved in cell wall biosynthesis
MIVGKIWDSEYPWDVRVEKVGRALVAAGHTVHLVCRNRRLEANEERVGDFFIHRMSPWTGAAARLDGIGDFPAFVNPRWYTLARDVFRRAKVDVILCRDLPLAPLALAVGRALARPVAVDVAEHYPGLLADLYNRRDFRLVNLLVRNPLLAALVERATLPRADAVLVVVEEMAERLQRMGVDQSRITVVSNTPLTERLATMSRVKRAPRCPGAPLRLVYLGKVERSRGLGVVLKALALLGPGDPQVRLDVYGDGMGLEAERGTSHRLGLGDRVTFHGHLPYETILAALPMFDAGIIPHHATAHWNFTIQNKMFDYMAAGLPVIVSSMPPAARIVRETEAGVVFADRDPVALAALLRHFPGPDARAAMGAAGRKAVSSRYNWDVDGARLVASLVRIAVSTPGSLTA